MKRYSLIILVFIFFIGIIFGIFNNVTLTNEIIINYTSIIYFLLILLLSIFIPFSYVLLIIETLISGLIFPIFISNYGINGFLFSLGFILIFKLPLIFGYFLNSFYYSKMLKCFYMFLFKKGRKKNVYVYLKKMIVISIVMFIFKITSLLVINFFDLFSFIKP